MPPRRSRAVGSRASAKRPQNGRSQNSHCHWYFSDLYERLYFVSKNASRIILLQDKSINTIFSLRKAHLALQTFWQSGFQADKRGCCRLSGGGDPPTCGIPTGWTKDMTPRFRHPSMSNPSICLMNSPSFQTWLPAVSTSKTSRGSSITTFPATWRSTSIASGEPEEPEKRAKPSPSSSDKIGDKHSLSSTL